MDFSTLRPVFNKMCFQSLRFQDQCGRSAKMMQYMCIFAKECSRLDGPSGQFRVHFEIHNELLHLCVPTICSCIFDSGVNRSFKILLSDSHHSVADFHHKTFQKHLKLNVFELKHPGLVLPAQVGRPPEQIYQ